MGGFINVSSLPILLATFYQTIIKNEEQKKIHTIYYYFDILCYVCKIESKEDFSTYHGTGDPLISWFQNSWSSLFCDSFQASTLLLIPLYFVILISKNSKKLYIYFAVFLWKKLHSHAILIKDFWATYKRLYVCLCFMCIDHLFCQKL